MSLPARASNRVRSGRIARPYGGSGPSARQSSRSEKNQRKISFSPLLGQDFGTGFSYPWPLVCNKIRVP